MIVGQKAGVALHRMGKNKNGHIGRKEKSKNKITIFKSNYIK